MFIIEGLTQNLKVKISLYLSSRGKTILGPIELLNPKNTNSLVRNGIS